MISLVMTFSKISNQKLNKSVLGSAGFHVLASYLVVDYSIEIAVY